MWAEPHYSRVIRRKHFKLQKFIINVNQNVPIMYRILFSRMILDGIGNSISLQGNFHFQQFLKHTILLQAFFQRRTKKEPIFRK
jgi:hypothetical protein